MTSPSRRQRYHTEPAIRNILFRLRSVPTPGAAIGTDPNRNRTGTEPEREHPAPRTRPGAHHRQAAGTGHRTGTASTGTNRNGPPRQTRSRPVSRPVSRTYRTGRIVSAAGDHDQPGYTVCCTTRAAHR